MDLRSGTPPVTRSVADGDDLDRVAEVAARLEAELAKVIVGQQRVVREILMAFLAGGHCLLRGVPGLAKTLLIKKLAEAVDLKFNRIQFTPDLMPSDILGAEVIEEDARPAAASSASFEVRCSPISCWPTRSTVHRRRPRPRCSKPCRNQVTVNGVRFDLDRPLFVLATQNPIEQEGTYPLPEAQLDRFMFNVVIDYPTADEERRIIYRSVRGIAARPRFRAVAARTTKNRARGHAGE